MPIDLYTTTLILGVIVALIGGSIGYKLVATRGKSISSTIFNERLGLVMEQNKELKKALASAKGSLGQMKEGLTLPNDTDLEKMDSSGFNGVIKGLIGKYSNMVPPQLRPFLQDPAIVNFLLEEAKKHPEQTKEVLKHFISNNGSVSKLSDGNESGNKLEDFQASGA